MWTWNDDTPAIVPAGARISAGKFGSVARSFPKAADSSVKRSPTSCIPSPESPANLITTRSSVSTPRVGVASTVTVDHQLSAATWLCFSLGAAASSRRRGRLSGSFRHALPHATRRSTVPSARAPTGVAPSPDEHAERRLQPAEGGGDLAPVAWPCDGLGLDLHPRRGGAPCL